jgi:hypothetical protein
MGTLSEVQKAARRFVAEQRNHDNPDTAPNPEAVEEALNDFIVSVNDAAFAAAEAILRDAESRKREGEKPHNWPESWPWPLIDRPVRPFRDMERVLPTLRWEPNVRAGGSGE